MAAPSGQMKASRYFAALALILVVLYALVFFTGNKRPTPKLGLDLQGGTSLTLLATTTNGKAPDKDRLDRARDIIAERVDQTGVSSPDVVTSGNDQIVVSVAGKSNQDQMRKLVAPAELRFRRVLASTSGAGDLSASPTPSASASKSSTPSKAPAVAPSGGAKSAAPGTSASPSPSASGSAAVSQSNQQKLDAVIKKLGPAYAAAQSIQDPSQIDPSVQAMLKPFSQLSGEEVAVLPASIQYNVPNISCKQLNARDPGAVSDPKAQVVACGSEKGAATKYKLDVARVTGEDVKSASYSNDPTNGWVTNLSFKDQDKWTGLTRDVTNDSKDTNKQVAIVLDNEVVSAPAIQAVIPGDAIIYGQFTQQDVMTLSQQLKYGSLPLSFKILTLNDVTPTLGTQQMLYGILAGGIGLALVIVYCMIYYRALGLVVIASLCASGATIYASLVLLGRSSGYTLTLAGIAGFIVAIGITADSFVVFFERLKDEVKDGRTVRSAVPRAWVRARRTILSADTVSFLAAAVLYFLAIGDVKGFAFTLGLSTLIDVVVVFLFTHPLVATLSRLSAFTSPRVSGLGNLRSDKAIIASESAGSRFGTVRTKES